MLGKATSKVSTFGSVDDLVVDIQGILNQINLAFMNRTCHSIYSVHLHLDRS